MKEINSIEIETPKEVVFDRVLYTQIKKGYLNYISKDQRVIHKTGNSYTPSRIGYNVGQVSYLPEAFYITLFSEDYRVKNHNITMDKAYLDAFGKPFHQDNLRLECSVCKNKYARTVEHWYPSTLDALRTSICRTCTNKRKKAWYQANRAVKNTSKGGN